MPQVIIKRKSVNRNKIVNESNDVNLSDEIIVTVDQVVVNSSASVTVTYAESEIVVDLARQVIYDRAIFSRDYFIDHQDKR